MLPFYMRKFAFGFLILALCGFAIFSGVSAITRVSATHFLAVPDDINYFYLSSPRMAVGDNTHLYVVHQVGTETRLSVFTRTTPPRETVEDGIVLPNGLLDIALVGGNVFFLFENRVIIHNATLLRTASSLPTSTPHNTHYFPNVPGTSMANWSVFNVSGIGTNFRILFASGNSYGSMMLTSQLVFSEMDIPLRTLSSIGQIIGITCKNDAVYALASDRHIQPTQRFNIYRLNPTQTSSPTHVSPLHIFRRPRTYPSITNFSSIQTGTESGFAFLSGPIAISGPNTITFFHYGQADPVSEVPPEPYSRVSVRYSFDPIFLSVRGGEILVVDAVKSSIDEYGIENGMLAFVGDSPLLAHFGMDAGFLYTPQSLAIIEEGTGAEGRLVVADSSDYIKLFDRSDRSTSSPFIFHNDDFPFVTAMVFNNNDTLFTYTIDRQIHRFSSNGRNPIGQPISTFLPVTGTDRVPFGLITSLINDPSDGTIFAIDADNRALLRFDGTDFRRVPTTFEIGDETRGTIAGGSLVLMNTIVGSNRTNHVLNLRTSSITYTTLTVPVTSTCTILDVATDALGDLVVLVQEGNGALSVLLMNLQGAHARHPVPSGTTASLFPSAVFDRLSNTLYWIGTRHAIEAMHLRNELWGFRNWNGNTFGYKPHYAWDAWETIANNRTRAVQPWRLASESTELFMEVSSSSLLFDFPNSIRPRSTLTAGTRVLILSHVAEIDGLLFPDYAYVLVGRQTGYVNRTRFLTSTAYVATTVFDRGPLNPDRIGRVVVNNAPIYKYPTGIVNELLLSSVNMNHATSDTEPGLIINRRITVPDARDWTFFEVRLNADGTPNPDGRYVGFISIGHVINFFYGPSNPRFVSNARVNVPRTENPRVAPVFYDSLGLNPNGDFLPHNHRIRINGPMNGEFTRIIYQLVLHDDEDFTVVIQRHGYIKTSFIIADGLTTLQLIGIIIAVIGAIAAVCLIVLHFKRRRTQT